MTEKLKIHLTRRIPIASEKEYQPTTIYLSYVLPSLFYALVCGEDTTTIDHAIDSTCEAADKSTNTATPYETLIGCCAI